MYILYRYKYLWSPQFLLNPIGKSSKKSTNIYTYIIYTYIYIYIYIIHILRTPMGKTPIGGGLSEFSFI